MSTLFGETTLANIVTFGVSFFFIGVLLYIFWNGGEK